MFGSFFRRQCGFVFPALVAAVFVGLVLGDGIHPTPAQATRTEITVTIRNSTSSVLVAQKIRSLSPSAFESHGEGALDPKYGFMRTLDLDPGKCVEVTFKGQDEHLYGDIEFSAHKPRPAAEIRYDPIAERFGFSGFSDIYPWFAHITVHVAFNWHNVDLKRSLLEKLITERINRDYADGVTVTQTTWPALRATTAFSILPPAKRPNIFSTPPRMMRATVVLSEAFEADRLSPVISPDQRAAAPASSQQPPADLDQTRNDSTSSLSSIGGPG